MMNRVGYNLAPLDRPANEPKWARDLTDATQAVKDREYIKGPGGLDNYFDRAEMYIQTQIITRQNSADPRNYRPPAFPMEIPRRSVVTYDVNGNMGEELLPADPGIQRPEPLIPPYDPPSTGPGFHSTASADGGGNGSIASNQLAALTQMMAAIMNKLVSIESRLTAAGK